MQKLINVDKKESEELILRYLPIQHHNHIRNLWKMLPALDEGEHKCDIFFELDNNERKNIKGEKEIKGYFYNSNQPHLSEVGPIWVDLNEKYRIA